MEGRRANCAQARAVTEAVRCAAQTGPGQDPSRLLASGRLKTPSAGTTVQTVQTVPKPALNSGNGTKTSETLATVLESVREVSPSGGGRFRDTSGTLRPNRGNRRETAG